MATNISKSGPISATGVLHTLYLGEDEYTVNVIARDIGTGNAIILEQSVDNATWFPALYVYKRNSVGMLQRTSHGIVTRERRSVDMLNSGNKYIRARVVTYSAGTVDVELEATKVPVWRENRPGDTTPRPNTIAFLGDSITAAAVNQNTTILQAVNNNRGHQTWVPILTRQRVQTRQNLNFGISGNTSYRALARIQQVVEARPRWCAVLIGTNDIQNSVGVDQTKVNLKAIWDTLLDAGIRVIGQTLTPRDMTTGGNQEYLIALNQWIKSMHRYRPDFFVADAYQDIVDPTSATGATKSGWYYDTTHPKANAGYYVGKAIANIINQNEPDLGTHYLGAGDFYSANYPFGNMLTNGIMAGTAGTLSGGTTGSVADSWTANISSAPGLAQAASKVAGTKGNTWQQLVGSGTVTGGAASLALLSQAFGTFTNFAIGDLLVARCEFEVDAGLANVSGIGLQLRSTQSGTAYSWVDGHAIVSDDMPTEAFSGVLHTPPMPLFAVPTVLDVQARIYIKQATATTAYTVRFGQFELRKI